jgi:XTP/dITP diphosphohydrolase
MENIMKLYFATSNEGKFNEVRRILAAHNISVEQVKLELTEIQSDDLEIIAAEKAKGAYRSIQENVMIEDDALLINALNNFPGAYSAFVYKTIGNDGILKLMEGVKDRKAEFKSVIAYCDSTLALRTFVATINGNIAECKRGQSWGYDPIFIPSDRNPTGLTYAELGAKKNELSHRKLALELFAEWYR